MTKQVIIDKILEMVCNKFGIEKDEICLKSTIYGYSEDFLNILKAISDIEAYYKISIPDEVLLEFYSSDTITVEDFIFELANYIAKKLNKNLKHDKSSNH
jgi:hypothetical protein